MKTHKVKVYPSKFKLKKKDQLAWKIAQVATDKAKLDLSSVEMVINRIIDNAAVAVASLNRKAVISAREMAITHPKKMAQLYLALVQKNYSIANGPPGQMEPLLESWISMIHF